jgi:hypothetical protein
LIQGVAADIAPCVPAADTNGWFLASGGRFYVDWSQNGDKPEFATPECSDPVTLARAVQDGDLFMQQLARRIEQKAGGEMLFSKTNVDYASPNTWGAHESYMIQRGHDFQKGLVPFLCSRVIFSGSGGFSNLSQGLEFLLSTRVPHIQRISGPDSQVCRRPIIHTRDESHGRTDDQRIHLILGEGLMGETGNLLKVATTALVVGLIEAGRDAGRGVTLKNPLGALRAFARDPSCQAVAKAEGRRVRAIDIQRHYLKLAGDHLGCLPVWAESVCALWKDVLDRLESGEEQKTLRLDWVIRRQLFTNQLRHRGLSWEALSDPDSIPNFSAIRSELFELDTKFGRIGEAGIFQALDAQGCLRHQLQGERIPRESIATRAVIRGAAIQQAWEKGLQDRVTADWTFLCDSQDHLELNMDDPFETAALWRPCRTPNATSERIGWLRRLRGARSARPTSDDHPS